MSNEIADGIYWVGAHFSEPPPGFSINCFLIRDEKVAVIDTGAPVSCRFVIPNIKALVDPEDIDYVVITHADVDHVGGLGALLEEAPNATVLTSGYEARGIGYWGVKPQVKTVEDGETLSLGRHRLRFISAPYSCMPGTVLVFDETEGVLFSADLFAALGPSEWKLFADTDLTEMMRGVQEIKLGNTHHTKASLTKVSSLPAKIIASSHGAMINSNIRGYTEALLADIS